MVERLYKGLRLGVEIYTQGRYTHTHTHKIYTHKRLFLERDSCMHVERFLNKLL